MVYADTLQVDWTAGFGVGAFLDDLPGADTVTLAQDSILQYPTFFSENGSRLILPYGDGVGAPVERLMMAYDLPFWVLLVCLALMAMLRFAFPRRMKQLVYSLAGERWLHTLMREGNLFEERISLGLTLVFAATTALFLQELSKIYFVISIPWAPGWLIWSLLLLAVLSWWTIRNSLIRLIGEIFGTQQATVVYLVRNLTFTLVQGMVLSVLLPLHYYTGWTNIIPATLALLLSIHAYRIIRNVISGISESGYGIGYQLLFVLSVEVLPLAILARVLWGLM